MRDAAGEQLLRIAREVCEALELSPHAHAVLDLDGRIVAVNATLLRWTGRASDGELVGAAVARDDDVPAVMALTRARFGESVTLEVRAPAPFPELPGSFRMHLTPVRVGSRVVGVGLMLEDVGHRSSAASTGLPFRDIVDGVPHGLLVERAGVVLYANRAALGMLAYGSPDELVGLSLYEIVRPGFIEELRAQRGSGDGAAMGHVVLLGRDGRAVNVVVRARPLGLGQGPATLLSFSESEPAVSDNAGASEALEAFARLERALTLVSGGLERAAGSCAEGDAPAVDQAARALKEAMALARRLASDARERGRERSPADVQRAEAAPRAGTVLVCDDESRLAMLTAGLLDQYGYAAVTAATGEEALAALGAGTSGADVVLLDLNLPDQGADDVLRRMRERGFRQPVILTSGYAEEDVPPQLLADPQVAAYLAKPYSVEHLVSSVRHALSVAESAVSGS